MAVKDLIPWGRSRGSVPSTAPGEQFSPFLALHREMNRLFDDVFNRFDAGAGASWGLAGRVRRIVAERRGERLGERRAGRGRAPRHG